MLQPRITGEVSHSHATESDLFLQCPEAAKRIGRAPSYLYRQGTIYYFRYAFTAQMRERFSSREIRLSLRTGFKAVARKKTLLLRAYIEELLSNGDSISLSDLRTKMTAKLEALIEGERQVMERKYTREELGNMLNDKLRELFDEILAEPKKTPPTPDEIRRRCNAALKRMLDDDAQSSFVAPLIYTKQPDGTEVAKPVDFIHDGAAKEITRKLNSLEDINSCLPLEVLQLVADGDFRREEITEENVIAIARIAMQNKAILEQVRAARLRGDYSFEQQFYAAEVSATHKIQPTERQTNSKQALMLSEFIEKYKYTKIHDGNWTERNVPTHMNRIETLLFILGDKPIDAISREDMRLFKDKLQKLPPNRCKKKEYKGKSVDDIIAMSPEETLNIKTINTTLQTISGMFSWAVREELLDKNPAQGLELKDERQDIELKEPFTNEDIKNIFFSGDYVPEKFKNPAYYWVPLIGLYSGMRLEEICQLHCEDIYEDDGIWIFNVTDKSSDGLNDKNLKTPNARRQIPVHDTLIKLGLLEYHRKMKRKKHIRLFPLLNKTDKSPKYGKQVGKQFVALLKRKEIAGKKSFHSLRHTFSDFFKMRDLHNDVFRQVFGHGIKELAGKQYGSKFPPKLCYEKLITKLHYDGEPQGGQPEPAAHSV